MGGFRLIITGIKRLTTPDNTTKRDRSFPDVVFSGLPGWRKLPAFRTGSRTRPFAGQQILRQRTLHADTVYR